MSGADAFFALAVPLALIGVDLIFCAIVADAAVKRGRSRAAYFWLSFFFSPILGGIILGIQGRHPEAVKPCTAPGCSVDGHDHRRPAYTPADYRRTR